jgi:predicted Zn-dependent peptidase
MDRRKLLRLTPLALATALALFASADGALIEKAEWLKLENGLQVVLIPQKSNPMVASTVIIRAGARHEPPGLAGATHLLEHLLFNGTARRTQKEIYDAIDRIGAYNNASTRADITLFQLLVHRDNLAEGLDIQADMLFNSTLPEEKFEKERGIVIEEIGQSFDLPRTAADRFYKETVFAGTPYSRPVLGSPLGIEALSRQTVLGYYKSFYRPSNMTLVLMGGLEREETRALLAKSFGLAGGGEAPDREAVGSLKLDGRKVIGRRVETKRTYLNLTFGAPRPRGEDYPAFSTLVSLLNSGATSRLERLFHGEETPTVYAVGAGLESTLEAPVFTISATLPPEEDSLSAIRVLLEEMGRIAEGDLSDGAVERARVETLSDEAFLSENIMYYAFFKAPYLAAAPPEWVRSLPSRLQQVTRDDVVASAKRVFKGRPFIVTVYGPSAREGEHTWEELPPPKAAEAASAPSTPQETKDKPKVEVTRRRLDNGLTLIVKEAPDTKVFALHLLVRDRALWEPRDKTGIAELSHRLLTEGTTHRSAKQVSRDLASIGARLKVTDNPAIPYDDYYFSPEYSYVRFETLDAFAPEGLAQLADLIRHPRFEEEAVERIKGQQLDEIARAGERARSQAGRLFRSTLFGDHPIERPVLGTASTVESITAEDLRAFHAQYFSPGNLIIAVVSPRPADDVMGWLAFYFGQKPEDAGQRRNWPALAKPKTALEASKEMGKAQSYFYLGQLLEVPEAEREALEVMIAILSDRLGFALRERRGLAYSVGSGVVQTQAGWYFVAGIGTREENLDDARKGILEAIATLQNEPPDGAEIKKTVNGIIGAAFRRRLTGISQAYYLSMEEYRGRPLGGEEAWTRRLRQVSPEDVMRASKLLKPDQMTAVTVR